MAQEIITLECTEAKALGRPPSRYMTTRNKKKPAHAQPAREKEIQSVFKAAYVAPRNEIILNGTQDRQTPFGISSREPHHAAPPDRHRHRGDRLQESRSP